MCSSIKRASPRSSSRSPSACVWINYTAFLGNHDPCTSVTHIELVFETHPSPFSPVQQEPRVISIGQRPPLTPICSSLPGFCPPQMWVWVWGSQTDPVSLHLPHNAFCYYPLCLNMIKNHTLDKEGSDGSPICAHPHPHHKNTLAFYSRFTRRMDESMVKRAENARILLAERVS